MYLVFLREILAAKILPEMEFYKMGLKKDVPRHILFHAFGVRTNLYLRIVPVNGTIIGGILNR